MSPADALSEGKFFITFLTVASETCWKENLLLSWKFTFIIRILGLFEKLSMIPWTLSSLTLTFEGQLNKLSESVTVSKNELQVFEILSFSVKNSLPSALYHG